MRRIFYDVNPGAESRPWGMGKIYHPSGPTTIPDKAHDALPWRYIAGVRTPRRKPGLYTVDGDKDLLRDPVESVHLFVRIRYLYDGKGLDDKPHWPCRALKENGYRPVKQDVAPTIPPSGLPHIFEPYYTVGAGIVPFFDDIATARDRSATAEGHSPSRLVRTEQPHEKDLQSLADPTTHWVYIKTNEKLVAWQAFAEQRMRKGAAEGEGGERGDVGSYEVAEECLGQCW